jgi:hypothetical protein
MFDTLPMKIALIALLLFKLQVYLTSLCHYYYRPITLSTFRLLHQSTLHHMVSINILQLPIKKFFLSIRLAPYTHSTASHSLSYPEFNCNNFFQPHQFPQAYFHLNRTHKESWDPLTAILRPSLIFKFNYGTALREIVATFIISSTLNSIDRTLMATTAAHAIRHCNTSSARNTCNWCNLVIFSYITYKFYCSNVSFMIFLHSSPLLFVLFPSKLFYSFLPFPVRFVPTLKFIFIFLFSFNSFRIYLIG